MSDKIVLILTGPGGAGKTTVAKLLEEKSGFIYIDGDQLDTEFFPDGNQWFPENLDKLKLAHKKILAEAEKSFSSGENNVVVDYIIFGDYLNFIKIFKEKFGDALKVVVLFPNLEETIKRDKERECWTAGEERIKIVRGELEQLKEEIGAENFVDTSDQSPREVTKKICNI